MPPKKKTKRKKKEKVDLKNRTLEVCKKKNIKFLGKEKIKTDSKHIKEIRLTAKTFISKIKYKNKDNILCLDMSKRKPGICIMDYKGKIIEAYSIPGATKNKALEIYLDIERLIDKYKPKIVLFESVYSGFKKATFILNLYQGIIYGLCLTKGIEVKQVSNLTVKSFFGVKTKENLFVEISSLYDLNLKFDDYNDEVDAIAIGLAYLVDNKIALKME